MATGLPVARPVARPKAWQRAALPSWTAQAWVAIAVVALFLGTTCWWLTQDHSIPIFDAGLHLTGAFLIFERLSAGDVGSALTLTFPYPPFAYLVGDLGILLGGVDVAPPIIAENLVFVPLLALGCYHVGRMAFNRTAGLLAVVFVLGSPLVTAQFHVFMIDAPETAMVAVSVWAILATDCFSRVRTSAVAGVAVGLGLLTKEPFVFFVAGPVAVTAVRGGVTAWRGLAVFLLVALVMAVPWYVNEFTQIEVLGSETVSAAGSSANIAPARLSLDNLQWYFWNLLDAQLYAPLLAFSLLGGLWATTGFVRRHPVGRFGPELAVGAFVAWLAITETFPHDPRYSMPLMVYLAVYGVGWITTLPRAGLMAAATILVLVAAANFVGTSFGAGERVTLRLPGAGSGVLQHFGRLTIFSNVGFLVSGPQRDGDMLATLRALRHSGVRVIVLAPSTEADAAFSVLGMTALDEIASLLTISEERVSLERLTDRDAVLTNGPVEAGHPPPCLRLANATGVWIVLGDPSAPGAREYCPSRDPRFYG